MRTAAAPLMWASAGPCVCLRRGRPAEGRGFPAQFGLLSHPLSLHFLRGLQLKNTQFAQTTPLQPELSLWNDRHCQFSSGVLLPHPLWRHSVVKYVNVWGITFFCFRLACYIMMLWNYYASEDVCTFPQWNANVPRSNQSASPNCNFHFSTKRIRTFIFTCTQSFLCARLGSQKLLFSHWLQFTLHCLSAHTVPFYRHRRARIHTPKCTRLSKHRTHARAHTHAYMQAHTLCRGKSLALAASYLGYGFASTGGCYSDNNANTTWPVNLHCNSCLRLYLPTAKKIPFGFWKLAQTIS